MKDSAETSVEQQSGKQVLLDIKQHQKTSEVVNTEGVVNRKHRGSRKDRRYTQLLRKNQQNFTMLFTLFVLSMFCSISMQDQSLPNLCFPWGCLLVGSVYCSLRYLGYPEPVVRSGNGPFCI